jgi:hypothetical protein
VGCVDEVAMEIAEAPEAEMQAPETEMSSAME